MSYINLTIEQHEGGYLLSWSTRRGDPLQDHIEPMTEIYVTFEAAKERMLELFDGKCCRPD